jgi:hypothetical protein
MSSKSSSPRVKNPTSTALRTFFERSVQKCHTFFSPRLAKSPAPLHNLPPLNSSRKTITRSCLKSPIKNCLRM